MARGATFARSWRAAGAAALAMLALVVFSVGADAQRRRERATPLPPPPLVLPKATEQPAGPPSTQPPAPALPPETIQADVSTRRVAVTSSFSGIEIVVFGTVENSRQTSAESGLYDLVIVVSGTPARLISRKKSRVAGIWINTDSVEYLSVPTYYSIASTRPLDEIASDDLLRAARIGFDHVPLVVSPKDEKRPAAELKEFRDAVIRLKVKEKLYQREEYNAAFIGRSLFRASIDVPANVTLGGFETRVYLFRQGELLSRHATRLELEREGVENMVHALAYRYPLSYGIATVALALGAGLLASTLFRKGAH